MKNNGEYILELFDSNGPLNSSCYWETNVLSLVKAVREMLESKLQALVTYVEVRAGLNNINVVGSGNCDALTLYYAMLRTQFFYEQSQYDTRSVSDVI